MALSPAGRTAVVLFTRDLRVHDHPALAAGGTAARQVPLFVLDDAILASRYATPNRVGFLVEALADLRRSLRAAGADLVVRRGDPVAEAVRLAREVGADAVHASGDVPVHARRRQRQLAEACGEAGLALHLHPGITVVPPDDLRTGGDEHYKVFTPYWRAWRTHPRRRVLPAPPRLALPDGVDPGPIPAWDDLVAGARAPAVLPGGEAEGRRRLARWDDASLADYGDHHDDLAADDTSRLSPYLHFGCLSPLEVAVGVGERPGAEEFVRQLCWRDFHHQVTEAHPRISWVDYRPRGHEWRRDEDLLAAWAEGRTGYPIVDAGMRQLREEGWMHNRARLITASFLVKDLYVDWRLGAQVFLDHLVDGDIVNNSANWQWVAGTGNDTRPYRVLNPILQAERHDPEGAYVWRWVPELAGVAGKAVHEPWRLGPLERAALDYPEPLVDHREAAAAFRARHP